MSNANHTHTVKPRRWIWWGGGLLVLAGFVAWSATRPPEVGVAAAEIGDLSVTVTATGEVEGHVADLSSTIAGQVEAVYRDEGDWVSRGDLLCRITAAPMGAAFSALTSHETIEAPFDGVISRRLVDPGDPALPGQPLFQVADLSEVWVTALIDDIDIAKLQEGQDVQIVLPSYLGNTLKGRVERINATATPRTEMGTGGRVVRTRIELVEGPGPLRPGMEVDVRADAVIARGVLLIPADAVIEDETGRYVFRVEGNRVRRVSVTLGANNYLQAQVTDGLNVGDLVVVDGKENLSDGDRVRTVRKDIQP